MTLFQIFICLTKPMPSLNSYQSNWYDQFTLEMHHLLMYYFALKKPVNRDKSIMEPHLWAAGVVSISNTSSLCCHINCSTSRPGLKHITYTSYKRLLGLNNNITNAFVSTIYFLQKKMKEEWWLHVNTIYSTL